MKKEDFIIVEYDYTFIIERSWIGSKGNHYWGKVNHSGEVTTKHWEYGWQNGLPIKPLSTLIEAQNKIKWMIKGKIIHTI